ncbi:MAG: ABC transporter ATP-binding protein [Pseudomonadota bacterium]
MTALALTDIRARLGGRLVVDGASLTVRSGECVGLIGPNGAGKSTLMRAALGLIPFEGASSLAALPHRQRALAAAWLPQAREIAWDLAVETLVSLGRAPHRRFGAPPSEADRAAVDAAMRRAEVEAFRDRPATQLSGGEQARVLLARALAQDAPLLMADEPIAALDPAHQIATMETFAALAGEGRAVLTALHDLGLAARWCDRLVMMREGRIVAEGAPREVLTPERLRAVYGIEAHIAEMDGGVIVQPVRRSSAPG